MAPVRALRGAKLALLLLGLTEAFGEHAAQLPQNSTEQVTAPAKDRSLQLGGSVVVLVPPALPQPAPAPPVPVVPAAVGPSVLPPSPATSVVGLGTIAQHPWRCGLVEDGVVYLTQGTVVSSVPAVPAAADCAALCVRNAACSAWTWHRDTGPEAAGYCASFGCTGFNPAHTCQCNEGCQTHNSCCSDFQDWCPAGTRRQAAPGTCVLKALLQAEKPLAALMPGVVSGALPCNMQEIEPPGTMFCFALVMPEGYEPDLLRFQYSEHAGVFGCDGYTIYSSQSVSLIADVQTVAVNSTLKCTTGGEFGTWLNTEIFLLVWRKVVADAVFQKYDWTVKADADAVFLPVRLRSLLAHHAVSAREAEGLNGVYLNNCRMGLHGPIEVLSRRAVFTWVQGADRCVQHFTEVCSGDCQWGEDLFMDQCLQKVLNARRENDWDLLLEDHCEPAKGVQFPGEEVPSWQACSTGHASFHPFKSVDAYRNCLTAANALSPVTSVLPTTTPETTTVPVVLTPAPGACAAIGCNTPPGSQQACQCDSQCQTRGDCCGDYAGVCLPAVGTGATAAWDAGMGTVWRILPSALQGGYGAPGASLLLALALAFALPTSVLGSRAAVRVWRASGLPVRGAKRRESASSRSLRRPKAIGGAYYPALPEEEEEELGEHRSLLLADTGPI